MKKLTKGTRILLVLILTYIPFYACAQSTEAQRFYTSGKAQLDGGEYDRAFISLTEAIRLHPQYADAYNLRGKAYARKGEYDIAIADFRQALKIKPDMANAYYNLGNAYISKDNGTEAAKMFKEAVRLDPNDVENYHGLIRSYGYTTPAAFDVCNEMILRFPDNSSGYSSRAAVYKSMKQYDKAIKDCGEAIRIEPTNAELYKYRGDLYRKYKKYDLAISDYNEAIKREPSTWYWNAARGDIYFEKGNKDSAIISYNEAIRVCPDPGAGYRARAGFYEKIKENNLALKDYEAAIKIWPSDYNYVYRGHFYTRKRQYTAALDDFSKAMDLEGTKTQYFDLRGMIYRYLGEYDKAIADYKTDIANDAKYSTSAINIVPALVRKGLFDEAKEYAGKFIDGTTFGLDREAWKFFKFYIKVVSTDLPAKSYTSALQHLDQAISDYKQFSAENEDAFIEYIDVLVLKAYVLTKLGHNKEAKELYEQALLMHPTQPDVKAALANIQNVNRVVVGNDKLPPTIQLISPQAARGLKIVNANSKIEIIGRAVDASGIASVTINDTPVQQIEEDGLFIAAVMLKQGVNDVVIGAADKKGNTASRTFSLTATVSQDAAAKEAEVIMPLATDKPPVYHAILIAANDYEDPAIDDLENPLKDASELQDILQTNYTFDAGNITTLFNKSREEIMQALVVKSSALTDNDNLLIFYAGHGIAEKDKFGDVDGYWVPSSAKKGLNASYISADDINKALKRSNSRHILVIADACFSGAFTRTIGADASLGVQKQFAVPSRKIMASGNLEPVPDNSRFVYYLKKNLKENADKYLTAKKLFDSFYEAILNNSETSPQYTAIKNVGDEGGQFVFIKKQQ